MKNIFVTAFVFLTVFAVVVSAQDNIEKKKIEYLISSVENLKSAKFIRNGSEYAGKQAAEHLRMKLQKADDVIKLCASQSYITGKPYMIKFSDGKTIRAEEFFRNKLKEYSSTVR
jgi:hypothetical protein